MEIQSLKLANEIELNKRISKFWDTKAYTIMLENGVMLRVEDRFSKAFVYTSLFNMIQMIPIGGAAVSHAPAPAHSEPDAATIAAEINLNRPPLDESGQPIQYDAKGKPIPKVGQRVPERIVPPMAAHSEDKPTADNPGYAPPKVQTMEERQKARREAETQQINDSQKPSPPAAKGKGKNLNDTIDAKGLETDHPE